MTIIAQLILTFGVLSLLSIGGANATLPEIHRQVVDQLHWMDDATFVSLTTIGQAAPGPNVLIVSMIGWHMAGLAGLLVATVAIVLPSSLLALGIGNLMTRYAAFAWIGQVRRALSPIALGLMLASGYVMAHAAYVGWLSLVLVTVATAAITLTRASPPALIFGGALIGVVAHHLDAFV